MSKAQIPARMRNAIITALVAVCGSAIGEEAGKTNADERSSPDSVLPRLPEVVVTATRSEEEAFSLPYSTSVVGGADLERRMPRTTPEALRELPSVMLQKTSHGQGSPYLRGFTGFRTLMLIDGIRLNNSTFRDGPNQYWSTVDNYALDRLEVVRGPSSVLYGSDAIGGTVNAIPLSRGAYTNGFDWDARLLYRFASAEDSHIGRAEFSGNIDEKVGFIFGGTSRISAICAEETMSAGNAKPATPSRIGMAESNTT
jgi:hemoglobin/transferrin/lactoferrin receptor protein